MDSNTIDIKILAVGDGYVGKSCMLISYTTKEFSPDYVQPLNYAAKIVVDGEEYNTLLLDTASGEDYEQLRALLYPYVDCALLCFSVANRASYDRIRAYWVPKIRHHCANIPIVLVATKIDLRDDPTQDTITTAEGNELRDKIKAVKYLECSAKTGQGLNEIFIEGVRSVLNKRTAKRSKCQLL